MTDHDSGAKDRAKEGGVAGATGPNVVPFPRSWYGAVDELVPISADPPRRNSGEADATAFWGGDSQPLSPDNDAVADAQAADAARTGQPGQSGSASAWGPRCGSGRTLDWSAPLEEIAAVRGLAGRRRRYQSALLAVGVCVALFFGADIAFAPDGASRPASATHARDKHHPSASIATSKSPPVAVGSTDSLGRSTGHRRRTRRDGLDHRTRPAKHVVVSDPVQAAQTQPATGSPPVVSSLPPASESTATTVVSRSASSAGGSQNRNVGGSGPGGGLPDVQQTNQQP